MNCAECGAVTPGRRTTCSDRCRQRRHRGGRAGPRRSAPPQHSATVWVYRLFDALGVPLYVGRTTTPRARLAKHARASEFWPRVAVVRWSQHIDPELAAIHDLRPTHNVIGVVHSQHGP